MKSIFLLSAALMISLSFNFYACNSGKESNTQSTDANTVNRQGDTTVFNIEPGPEAGFADLLVETDSAKSWIRRFRGKHDKDTTLSRSVWWDKKVFLYIAQYLDTAKNIDGLRLYMMQYPKKFAKEDTVANEETRERYNRLRNRTSIVIFPTREKNPVWEAWDPLLTKANIAGLNHGELCPSNCYRSDPEPDPDRK